MAPSRLAVILVLMPAALVCQSGFAADASYFRDVRPIIQRQCQGCHQPNLKSSNLDLTSYEGFQAGGKHGPAAKTLLAYLTGESKPQMHVYRLPARKSTRLNSS